MFAGIGIIGALASILASLLVSPTTPDEEPASHEAPIAEPELASGTTGSIAEELAGLRAEVAALRAALGPSDD